MQILEIQLLSNDIDKTEQFYHHLLGLETIAKDHSTVSFSAGTSKLTFIRSDKINPFYHFAFNIPGNKISEAFSYISPKTEILETSPSEQVADFTTWNAKAFYFYDNNGNILEFIARFDLDNNIRQKFDSSLILSISEIGIAVDNAAIQGEQIRSAYHFSYFEKQAPKDDFMVIGDDHGLLIFVDIQRNWFPTNKPAEKHWTKIKLEEKGRITELVIIP